MAHRFVEHTAELEVELEADSAEGLLLEALHAFAELAGGSPGGEHLERTVVVAAPDLSALLAAWLEELVFLSETEGLVPEDAEIELADTHLDATVRGRRGEPRHLVKAVTMHRLRFQQRNGVWHGRVVLDV